MLTLMEAKKIGNAACIDKLGREFVLANRDNGVSSYGEMDEGMYCYVGVSDEPYVSPYPDGMLVLDSESRFPYYASCIVNMESGEITFLDCMLPCPV